MLGREDILPRLPHGASMCLLDTVHTWDEQSIQCLAISHIDPNNPMADGVKGISTVALVEYAAQSAAVHASLIGGSVGEGRPAFIGAIKHLELHCLELPPASKEIHVVSKLEHASASGAIYAFSVSEDGQNLIDGRLVLVKP